MAMVVVRPAMASTSEPPSGGGVIPFLADSSTGGNVSCAMLGYENDSNLGTTGGNDYQGGDSFKEPWPDGISVWVTEGKFVKWESTKYPIGAVIVKGGPAANIYEYIPPGNGDSGLASPPVGGGFADLSNLRFCWNKALEVSKTAVTSYDRSWAWGIIKDGDKTELLLSPDQVFTVNYEVTVSAMASDTNHAVSGIITIKNPNSKTAATITSVADVISLAISATVDCGVDFSLPYTLAAGATLECSYSAELPNSDMRTNTATVTTSGKVAGGTGTADVTFGAPKNETDRCVDVKDDKAGVLGEVCATSSPFSETFEYKLDISYPTCGEYTYTNVASVHDKNGQELAKDDHNIKVTIPCANGCTLTQGYWKTHSEFGPAPYDDTWAKLPNGASTTFFRSGKSWIEVFGTPPAGNAYYNLAHQYMAATLNVLNSASTTKAVDEALTGATSFFENNTPSTNLTRQQRNTLLGWASTLDAYNNGLIGPGHCDEK
jgi:hypothetical protein